MKPKVVLPIIAFVLLIIICWQYYVLNQQSNASGHTTDKKNELWVDPMDGKSVPDIKFVDQHGKSVSLGDFKGKTVVLQFLDPVCTDICPLISKEVVDANKNLGDQANKVEFVAINVNPNHTKAEEMLEYSSKNGLIDLSNWHYLTGTPETLQKAWKAFNISVIVGNDPNGEVTHSPTIFFIDPHGKEQYLANPDSDTTQAHMSEWGKAIANYAMKTSQK